MGGEGIVTQDGLKSELVTDVTKSSTEQKEVTEIETKTTVSIFVRVKSDASNFHLRIY